jgi:regulator of RNase E activity RraB
MAANQDPNAILSHHIDAQDHKQLEQILRDGFLAGFGRFFSKANKLKMLS